MKSKKINKRTIFIIFLILSVGILFHGWVYRALITYESLGTRPEYLVKDEKLINLLDLYTKDEAELNIKEIIKIGLKVTSNTLKFTTDKNSSDPNYLITSKTANCIGYANFFAASCTHLINKYNLSDTWTVKTQVGNLFFLNFNLHKLSNSKFLKDHDFVTIENKVTGEILAVDPTANDYLYIEFITYKKP